MRTEQTVVGIEQRLTEEMNFVLVQTDRANPCRSGPVLTDVAAAAFVETGPRHTSLKGG
jgi:hypothetical protein